MKKILFALLVSMVVLLGVLLSSGAAEKLEETPLPPAEATAEPVETAPDFTVYDIDGNAVKLSDYFGKPIVLNFWASWCGPCKMEMPDFEAKYKELGDKVQFLMVNLTGMNETLEAASGYVASQGFSFPVLFDKALDAASVYGVNAIPATYFIDADGRLVTGARGAINAQILQQGIDLIYSE